MNRDKKLLYFISYSICGLLLLALFIPIKNGAPLAALITLLGAVLAFCFLKKREMYSYLKGQVTGVMVIMTFLHLAIYYLTVIKFGWLYSPYGLTVTSFFIYVLPITATILFSEFLRSKLLASHSKQAAVIGYFSCVIAEVLTCKTISQITNFNIFMDVVGITLLPAIFENILYYYLARRYGILPNIIYRLATGLFAYIIPVVSAIPDSLYSILKLLAPLIIYAYIDGVFEQKKKFALEKHKVLSAVTSTLILVCAVALTLFVSGQLSYKFIVIATPSMTGEINKGDAVVFDEYTDQTIEEGQIIVFEKNDSTIIHRVVAVDIINDEVRYTTKGDANEDNDPGYITKSNIVGVVKFKITAIGYPTLWLRSLFA